MRQLSFFADLRFDGPCYDQQADQARLTGQLRRVYDLMCDGAWRSLYDIAAATGDPAPSISAQLRHLRKPRFGAFRVDKRRVDKGGLWLYRLAV